ncbi:hypothetical protein OE88DRAFT_1740473 [Heliocybe sulcata]|uniref:Uncharacterized protein n=1 Tax=Heliocybe sulcata TaxID=5364 RepID=A0A5C3MIK0_9AGAM|nr:hypothetical protein OE88DRAFT_1740473 [Heliocybe sulcata]
MHDGPLADLPWTPWSLPAAHKEEKPGLEAKSGSDAEVGESQHLGKKNGSSRRLRKEKVTERDPTVLVTQAVPCSECAGKGITCSYIVGQKAGTACAECGASKRKCSLAKMCVRHAESREETGNDKGKRKAVGTAAPVSSDQDDMAGSSGKAETTSGTRTDVHVAGAKSDSVGVAPESSGMSNWLHSAVKRQSEMPVEDRASKMPRVYPSVLPLQPNAGEKVYDSVTSQTLLGTIEMSGATSLSLLISGVPIGVHVAPDSRFAFYEARLANDEARLSTVEARLNDIQQTATNNEDYVDRLEGENIRMSAMLNKIHESLQEMHESRGPVESSMDFILSDFGELRRVVDSLKARLDRWDYNGDPSTLQQIDVGVQTEPVEGELEGKMENAGSTV